MTDPFLDLIRLLRPNATLWTRVEASGCWGLSFHRHDDLLFCWVERGSCHLSRPDSAPIALQENDFVLVRTSTPFSLVSDLNVDEAEATDSESVLAGSGSIAALGSGSSPKTVLRGGKFIFDTVNEQLLTGLLPQVMYVASKADGSEHLRMLLKMNEIETSAPSPGSEFVIARLMELVLVEVLRNKTWEQGKAKTGLLAGLNDLVTAKALRAMHSNVAQPWTTEKLARLCGTSRSSLGARFAKIVGLGPIEYLQQWRIALAKDELRSGLRNIGEIAQAIGFRSGSAFSTAFTRATGCSPRQFVDRSRT